MRRIYIDYAAATPVDPRVLKDMTPYWNDCFGNPGAIHREGVAARRAVEESRRLIADIMGVHSDEIIFTGSATESANLALFGVVEDWRKTHPNRQPHIIVSAIEHDAVLAPAKKLAETGVAVTHIPVNEDGIVSLAEIKKAMTENTVVIAIMYANNEIGTIQPIRDIAKLIRQWKKNVPGGSKGVESCRNYPLLYTDACQAANYLDVFIPRLGVDLLTLNAAKIYGPKGVGLLVVKRGVPLAPQIHGGGHERGRRAGTENVAGIVGFARALRLVRDCAESESLRLIKIRDYVISELEKMDGVVINGSKVLRLPNNVHFSLALPHIDHEYLLLQLDANGIAVSTKSACHEKKAEESHVILALNDARGGHLPSSGIRLSLGRSTSLADAKHFLSILRKVLTRGFAIDAA